MASQKRTPPWKRSRPARTPKKLSDAQRADAQERARKAGRRYPNLVDNMTVASQGKRGAKRKRASAKKSRRGSRREAA